MPVKKPDNVTMRIRIGDSELEVTGPSDFVERKVSEFVDTQKYRATSAGPSEKVGPRERDAHPPASKKRTSAAQFFKKVSAQSDVSRGLAAAYYLETYKGEENFTAAEVRETIRQAKIRPPANPSDVIAKNIKKGYMMAAGDKEGKMAFVLTSDGEEAINSLLNE